MQQTQNYKLNLIETSDPFSPVPLNENAEKLEAALSTLDTSAAGLDARVIDLETGRARIAFGQYDGNGSAQTISLGFTPLFVYVKDRDEIHDFTAIETASYTVSDIDLVRVEPDGFRVSVCPSNGSSNRKGHRYAYIALG